MNQHSTFRISLLLNVGIAVLAAALLMRLVTDYWRYFRIGVAGGNGMFATFFALPAVALLFGGVAVCVALIGRRRSWGMGRMVVVVTTLCLSAAVLLFGFEVRRTADYPLESGEAIDVGEFLGHYFG